MLATAMTCLVISAPAQAASRGSSCNRAKGKTVAKGSLLRVYEVERGNDTILYACRKSSGRRVTLDSVTNDDYVIGGSFSKVKVAGLYVAWVATSTDASCKADCPPGNQGTSTVIKLRSVRRQNARMIFGPDPQSLVLTRRGAVAWTAAASDGVNLELHVSVRRGDDRVLDRGKIDPRSLAVEITIASWKRDGVEHFARLR